MYFKETKGNQSQWSTRSLSLFGIVTPHNAPAHSEWKIITPRGNNKTQLITKNATRPLFCLLGDCVRENGNKQVKRNTSEMTSSLLSPFVCQKPSLGAYCRAKRTELRVVPLDLNKKDSYLIKPLSFDPNNTRNYAGPVFPV